VISEDPLFSGLIRRAAEAEERVDHLTDLVTYMAMNVPKEMMPAHLQDLLDGIVDG
jgi:hypothetical protein